MGNCISQLYANWQRKRYLNIINNDLDKAKQNNETQIRTFMENNINSSEMLERLKQTVNETNNDISICLISKQIESPGYCYFNNNKITSGVVIGLYFPDSKRENEKLTGWIDTSSQQVEIFQLEKSHKYQNNICCGFIQSDNPNQYTNQLLMKFIQEFPDDLNKYTNDVVENTYDYGTF